MLVTAISAPAQTPFDPSENPKAAALIDARGPGESTVPCAVEPFPAHLNFSFRFLSGFTVSLPLKFYAGEGGGFAVITRFRNENSSEAPLWFAQNVALPTVPRHSKLEAQMGGSFYLGEGRYDVDLLLLDNTGRTCRKHWKVDARRSLGERQIRMALDAGAVEPVEFPGWHPAGRLSGAAPRITVLFHVAPLRAGATEMHRYDQAMLLGSLSSLLNESHAASVKLVAFNLDQQKELLKEDRFDANGWDRLVDAVRGLELGKVAVSVLARQAGHVDLLRQILEDELNAGAPPDAVIVLGPPARQIDKHAVSPVDREARHPPFFYFEYRPYFNRAMGEFPDVIGYAVHALDGKIYRIHSPAEFAEAIEDVRSHIPAVSALAHPVRD